MPRTRQQFAAMRDATKNKIQAAAMRLFVHKGFGATNVQDIADLAGISIGLLYRHYKTKEELFNALVEFSLAGLQAAAERFSQEGSPRRIFEQFVDEVYNDLSQGEDFANLVLLMTRAFFQAETSRLREKVARQNAALFHATARLIRRGQELGEFRAGDAYEMAVYFYATMQGLAEMKIALQDSFVMPSRTIISGFLFHEQA